MKNQIVQLRLQPRKAAVPAQWRRSIDRANVISSSALCQLRKGVGATQAGDTAKTSTTHVHVPLCDLKLSVAAWIGLPEAAHGLEYRMGVGVGIRMRDDWKVIGAIAVQSWD